MILQKLFKAAQSPSGVQYAKFLDGMTPVFSQFGQNIYASDLVQTCIDSVANELSKSRPRHIRRDRDGLIETVKGSALNRLFRHKPNSLMTTKEFIEKIVWLLYLNYNVFIYPTFTQSVDAQGNVGREYTGLYPLNPTRVEFQEDAAGTLYLAFGFANGTKVTLPYGDIIHLRKKFSVNDVMGGGMNGQPDQSALLSLLTINDTILQGIAKAVKTTLAVRGVIKFATMLDTPDLMEARKNFEASLISGNSALLPLDLKSEFTPVTLDPKVIDKDTLQFIQDKILNWYGVSVPILSTKFTDADYQAWYNKTLEPNVIGLGQAFSATLFSQRQQDLGHEVVFYHEALELLDVKSKVAIIDNLGNRGALTNNQMLALFGMEPYDEGNRRFVSLNYIDVQIANDYQMMRAARGNAAPSGATADDGGAKDDDESE